MNSAAREGGREDEGKQNGGEGGVACMRARTHTHTQILSPIPGRYRINLPLYSNIVYRRALHISGIH